MADSVGFACWNVAMFYRRFVCVLFSVGFMSPALAWGPLGHRVVAELAQRQLNPAAEAEVVRLLAPEQTRRLADVANWADEIQNQPAQAALWKQTRRQHYINFPSSQCAYVAPRDCRDGQCVVGGLQHYVAVLRDRSQSDAARREALKFVVHFAGDLHQPLHAGYRQDKGGNTHQVQFQGKGSNLHRVWDSGLSGSRQMKWLAYASMLDREGAVKVPAMGALGKNPYASWAEESCKLTAKPGFYPAKRQIGQAYIQAQLPLADRRMRVAGHRLAGVLNLSLGG